MSIKSLSLDDRVSSGVLFEQTEWITPRIYFLPANYRLPFCRKFRGVSARSNIQLPLFEFSYFKLDRSVNVESRLAPNFFDEYCYRNRSEKRDRIEPFSFKVAQLKFEKCSHRFVFVRLNLSRSELLFTPLWKQTAQSVDFNASKNF